MNNTFYSKLKGFLALKIFKPVCTDFFGYVRKQLNKKTKVSFKL